MEMYFFRSSMTEAELNEQDESAQLSAYAHSLHHCARSQVTTSTNTNGVD